MAEHDSEARSVATQAVDEVCSSVAGSPRINSELRFQLLIPPVYPVEGSEKSGVGLNYRKSQTTSL